MSLLSLFHSPSVRRSRPAVRHLPECSLDQLTLQQATPACDEQCCALGRWLQGEDARQLRHYSAFQQLQAGHLALHDIASEMQVLQEIGRSSDALELHAGEFSRTRHRVQQLLLALKSLE